MNRRPGFTLVELLVVIVIIGMLAGLMMAVAPPIIRRAHRMVITGEISQLDMALQQYRQKFGDYPPDFAGINVPDSGGNYPARDAVIRHLRQAFPRYRPGVSGVAGVDEWARFRNDVLFYTNNMLNMEQMTPATALVFWLGGLPAAADSSTKLTPFSANPANPFAPGGSRLDRFFSFDEARLTLGANNIYEYRPPHVKDPDGGENAPPYVYFQARRNGYIQLSSLGDKLPHANHPPLLPYFRWATNPGTGTCMPYAKSSRTVSATGGNVDVYEWFSPKTCQILCCGLDGIYGLTPANATLPTGIVQAEARFVGQAQNNLAPEEDDNLTNFAQGMLGDWHEGE